MGVGLGVGDGVGEGVARRRGAFRRGRVNGRGRGRDRDTGLSIAEQRPGDRRTGQDQRRHGGADQDPGREARGPCTPGHAAPGRLRCEQQAGADEAVAEGSASGGRGAGARCVREIALAPGVGVGQAELGLHAPVERGGRILGEASVRGVDPVDRHAPFAGESKERTDSIHSPEHSKSPTAEDGGADTIENEISRRRPIFPGGCPPSIFGAGELNFRVRDGNGWCLSASVTGIDLQLRPSPRRAGRVEGGSVDFVGFIRCAIQQRASRVN